MAAVVHSSRLAPLPSPPSPFIQPQCSLRARSVAGRSGSLCRSPSGRSLATRPAAPSLALRCAPWRPGAMATGGDTPSLQPAGSRLWGVVSVPPSPDRGGSLPLALPPAHWRRSLPSARQRHSFSTDHVSPSQTHRRHPFLKHTGTLRALGFRCLPSGPRRMT